MNNEVSKQLMGLTQQVVDAAVWQVKFWIPFELTFELGFVMATVVVTVLAWKKHKAIIGVMDDMWLLAAIVLGGCWLASLLVLLIGIPGTISAIYNPTYWAVKALLEGH